MPGNAEYRDADQREHVGRANQGKGRIAVVVLLVAAWLAFVLAGVTLLTGRPWLGDPTRLFGIPAGNLVAWVLHFTLPFAAWLALRHGTLRRAAGGLVVIGALWLPVSILLAGNVELNFQESWRSLAWLLYTAACLVLPVVLLAVRAVVRLGARSH